MPDGGSYSLTLGRSALSYRFPTRIAALLLAAGLGLAALTQVQPRAAHPAPARAEHVSVVQVPAPISETGSAITAAGPDQAPPLVSETSSVQVESPAPPPVQLVPQTAAQSVPVTAAVPAPVSEPPAATADRPGSRWASDGIVFVTDAQDWDAGSFTNVEAALSRLPARIRLLLGNRALGQVNVLVNRTGTALSGKQPYGGPANFFSTNDGHNELVMFPDQSVPTILHELGHAYNLRRIPAGRYALVLLDPEMQSFMAATGWRVLSTPDEVRAARDQIQVQFAYDGAFTWQRLSHNDPLEDFANSFSLYFYAPQELQQTSPERFAWFEANVGR